MDGRKKQELALLIFILIILGLFAFFLTREGYESGIVTWRPLGEQTCRKISLEYHLIARGYEGGQITLQRIGSQSGSATLLVDKHHYLQTSIVDISFGSGHSNTITGVDKKGIICTWNLTTLKLISVLDSGMQFEIPEGRKL